jgi:hypothetical protein
MQNTKTDINLNFELEEESSAKRGSCKTKLVKLSRDKMIVDMTRQVWNGNDGLETSKLPGVQLDKMKMWFRGNANLQIMMMAKPSLLTGEELKQFKNTRRR